MLPEWTLFTKQLDIVWAVLNNFPFNQVHLKVNYKYITIPLSYRYFIIGHIAGGFARHRYDLKIQMQQQAAAAAAAAAMAAQQQATDKSMTSVSRGDTTNGGVIHHLAHQTQHQPRTSSSAQRASTSLSAMR